MSRTGGLAALIRGEAVRNLRSGTTRALTFGLVWFALAASVLVWDALAVDGIAQDAAHYRSVGAATLVVASPGGIDGAQCERMDALPNVRGAGALRPSTSPLVPLRTPGVELPTFDATPGAVALLLAADPVAAADPGVALDGVFVSDEVADVLALHPGDTLATEAGDVVVAGVFASPDDGRRAGLGFAAVQTVPAGAAFDECRVAVWPESRQVQAIVTASVLAPPASDAGAPVIGQLNPTLGDGFDAPGRFRTRATALLPLAVLGGCAALGFVAVRLRRLELAAARGVGVGLRVQVGQLALETLAWLVPAATAALAVGVGTALAQNPGTVPAGVEYAGVVLGGGVACGLAGALLAVATVSPRRLHAYFRDR